MNGFMKKSNKRASAFILMLLSVISATGNSWPAPTEKMAQEMYRQFIESLRWSQYWREEAGLDQKYQEGNQVPALFFWTKTNHRPKAGFCSAALSVCVANPSNLEHRGIVMARTPPGSTLSQAFAAFGRANYGDGDAHFPQLSRTDFDFEEKTITLPHLGLPASILHRTVPKQAFRQSQEIKQAFNCWREGTKKSPTCVGNLVFAYYTEADLVWFVRRTCSAACQPEFRGDGIMSLRRSERGDWYHSGAGFSNTRADIERMKPKIDRAAMFRVKVP